VAEPSANDIHFDAGFEQVHCSRVSKDMGADASGVHLGPCLLEKPRVTANDLVDPVLPRSVAEGPTPDLAHAA
jgi:hypothetical protein